MAEQLLDYLLAVALVWLAWRVQREPELFSAVILFIVFGLVMAMTWVRLAAPDIALAEAAVGAGLTGALLLDAVRRLPAGRLEGRARPRPSSLGAIVTVSAVAALGAILTAAILGIDLTMGRLADPVFGAIDETGVSHPATAVLLNLRAYDTWLETLVLLAALLGSLAIRRSHDLRDAAQETSRDVVLLSAARVVTPMLVLVAAYVLWLGTRAPGGAFQSGALLGAAGLVLFLAGGRGVTVLRVHALRIAALAGIAAFGLAAVVPLVLHGSLLEMDPRFAPMIITAVEAFVALSVGVTLAALFTAARPVPAGEHPSASSSATPVRSNSSVGGIVADNREGAR